jgi:hypothetical protein
MIGAGQWWLGRLVLLRWLALLPAMANLSSWPSCMIRLRLWQTGNVLHLTTTATAAQTAAS